MKAEQEAGKPGVTMLGKTAILPEADSKKTKINTEKPVETMSQEETKPEEAKRDLGIGGGTMIKGRTVTKEALFQVEGERDKPQGIIRESKTTPKEAVSMEPEKEVEKPDGTLPKGESASKEDVTQKSSPAAKVVRRQKLATIDPVPSQATSFEIKLHQEDSKKPDGKAEGAASQEIKATDSNLGRKETKKSILTFALPVEDCSKKVELNVSLPTEVTSLEPKASKKVEPNVSLPTEVTSLEPNAQESEVREMRFKVATLKEVPSKRASPRRTRPRKAASEEVSQDSPVGTPTMTGSQDSTDIAVELKESTVDLETQADLVILSQSVSKEPPLTKRTLKEVADKEKIPAEEISPKEAPPTCFTPNKIASKETVSEAVVPKKAAPSKSLTEKLSSKDASHKETSSSKLAPNKSVSQKEVNTEEATPKELSWNNVPTKKTRLADDALVKNSAKKVACTHKKTASVETTFKSTTPILHEEVKKMPSMKATPKITSPKKGAPKDTTPKETETRRIASPGPVLKPAPSVDAAAGQNSSTTALSAPDLLDPKDPNSKTMSMDATSSPRAPRRSTQLTNVQNKTTPPRTQTKPHGSLQQKVSNKTSAKDSVLAISSQTSIITDTSTKDQDVKDRTLPGQKNTSHKISSDDAQKMVKPPPKTGSNVTSTKSTEAGLSRDTSSKSGIVREGKHVGKPKREDAKSSPAASKGKEQPQSASPASSVPAAPDSSKQVTLKVQDAYPVSSLQKKSSLSGAPETATLTSSTRNPEMVKDAGCKSPRSQSACPRQRNPQELDVSADVSMDEDRGEYIDVDELMAGEVIVLDEDSEDSDQEMEMTYDDDDILVIDTVGEVSGNVSGDDEEEEDTWIMEDADGDEEAGFDMPEFGEMFAIDEVGGSDDEEEEMEDQDVHEVDWWEVLSEAEED
ncbi:proteoglycan 4-like [Acanthaster planci]|uniref:Proteoglycan 4-like n=1 Tax=Acanthaster planci TaxID=133434 RepID=A0A8B7ZR97_ACAPL|nr:proteoglycan 4-like [Acanthaster planci]